MSEIDPKPPIFLNFLLPLFFGEILDGKQSHIFDVKSKKEIRKGWTFNYVEVCLTGVVVYTTCNYFALLGLMDYMEDR